MRDPKPEKRHRASRKEWEALREQKGAGCRVCGDPNYQLHHLVPRSLQGPDAPDNLVPLCARHHGQVEDRRLFIGDLLTLEEVTFIVDRKGHRFFDRYYTGRVAA